MAIKKKEKIFIWGAGGQGKVVLDVLEKAGKFEVTGFIDSDKKMHGKIICGLKVFGDKSQLDTLWAKGIKAGIVAVGDNETRCKIAEFLKSKNFKLVSAIHPQTIIPSNVLIGSNVTINAGVIIGTSAIIGDNAIINTGAIIEHENIIGNGVHVAPGAKIAGQVKVGDKTFVGIGATVIQCLKIGKNSIIGAGSVVIKEIPDNVVAVGIPAKIIKKR